MTVQNSLLVGYNDNLTYQGRVYHIQTEDSGVRHPHIISHLYADGGAILKTKKTSYESQLHRNDLPTIVRELMRKQHQAMCLALEKGRFDYLWDPDAPPPSSSSSPRLLLTPLEGLPVTALPPRPLPPPPPEPALPLLLQQNDIVRERSLDEILLQVLTAC